MLNLKGSMVELKGLFRRNNYVQLIINAALGYVSYYCDCGIHAATKIQVAMSLMVVGQKHYLNVVNHVALKPLCNALQESWFFYGL